MAAAASFPRAHSGGGIAFLSCLYPHRRDCFWACAVVMTVSNCMGVACVALWLGHAERLATKAFVVSLISIFIS